MICFEVVVDGEKLCTAGVGDVGVLTATISWVENPNPSHDVGPSGIGLHVGGLTDTDSGEDEFVEWVKKRISVGNTVTVRIVETAESDPPVERTPRHSNEHQEPDR